MRECASKLRDHTSFCTVFILLRLKKIIRLVIRYSLNKNSFKFKCVDLTIYNFSFDNKNMAAFGCPNNVYNHHRTEQWVINTIVYRNDYYDPESTIHRGDGVLYAGDFIEGFKKEIAEIKLNQNAEQMMKLRKQRILMSLNHLIIIRK